MKSLLLIASLLLLTVLPVASIPAASAAQPQPSAPAAELEACRQLRNAALDRLAQAPKRGEKRGPIETGREMLGKAIERCRAAAGRSEEPSMAAESMAEVYLAKEKLVRVDRGSRNQRLEALMEGIETVRGLHNDRSPASIELLQRAGLLTLEDDPERGIELVELAVEIARQAHGEDDPRYADQLRHLGQVYAPSHLRGAKDRPFADSEKAERVLRQALEIYLRQPELTANEGYIPTLIALRNLLKATGRDSEIPELEDFISRALSKER